MMMQEEEEEVSWKTPIHYRMTRRGKIIKNVKEEYIRNDLYYGYYVSQQKEVKRNNAIITTVGPAVCLKTATQLLHYISTSTTAMPHQPHTNFIIICDANVLIHNLDVLLHKTFKQNIVIPQTSLEECRHVSPRTAQRLLQHMTSSSSSGEEEGTDKRYIFFPNQFHSDTQITATSNNYRSMNDINDAKIRRVAEFYGQSLSHHDARVSVVLLTDDVASRKIAESNSYYTAQSVRQFVTNLVKQNPSMDKSLLDVVAQCSVPNSNTEEQKMYYPPHVSNKALQHGIKSGQYFQGHFRHSGNKSYVTVRKGSDRVAISIIGDANINRAMEGDVVAVQLFSVQQWLTDTTTTTTTTTPHTNQNTTAAAGIAMEVAEPRIGDQDNVSEEIAISASERKVPTGKVVGIVRRHARPNYCGSLTDSSSGDDDGQCLFVAVDKSIPPILIQTSQKDKLLGQRILVAIDAWPATSPHPLGHYVATLGKVGDVTVETQVVLQEHNIPTDPFPAKVLACLPPEDYQIELEDGRLDLRHLPILSIDPPGCKDIDDALHCTLMENGNYQVGVHIADVTHYVKPNSAMDLEAANRSTSTYLVNKRLDMLPSLLTTDLCSLKCNVNRFAFSILWEICPKDASIVNVEFHKSIIHSIAALTYQQAQEMIDDTSKADEVQVGAVQRLAKLARMFRQKRMEAGALTLASPEVKFVLDGNHNPTDVSAYPLYEANAVVEEYMLLANVTVAKKILKHYPTLSILRRHPAPNRSMFDSLIAKAKVKGIDIKIETSKQLADSLDAAISKDNPYFHTLLRILSTRCMSPAQYFCSSDYKPKEWHHYGLAAPVYTHFTSPIRRYADVVVHRLLAAAIGVDSLPISSKAVLHDLAANMNRRHRSAQLAGRASVQLHTIVYFSTIGEIVEDAYVLDISLDDTSDIPSFTVIVPKYGIEGRITVTELANDPDVQKHPHEHKFTFRNKSIQVFDKVRVKLYVTTSQQNQDKELVMKLVQPNFHTKSNDESYNNDQIMEEEQEVRQSTASSKKKKKRRKNQT